MCKLKNLFSSFFNAKKKEHNDNVIFIVKVRNDLIKKHNEMYGYEGSVYNKNLTGLNNSCNMTIEGFGKLDLNAKITQAVDGNSIDKLIVDNKANVVILEALWCPPYKIKELMGLHPNVKWYARIHSDIPFLAQEGISINYIKQYAELGVKILPNDCRATFDLKSIIPCEYFPNYYDLYSDEIKNTRKHFYSKNINELNIGCFGAVRSFKSQLRSAFIAIKVAKHLGLKLKFHINSERVEGDWPSLNALKNLRELLGDSLVEHNWLDRESFLKLCSKMDACIVTSLTETFNIVAADSIAVGTPVSMSLEVPWNDNKILPNDTESLCNDLIDCIKYPKEKAEYQFRLIEKWNKNVLKAYSSFIEKNIN